MKRLAFLLLLLLLAACTTTQTFYYGDSSWHYYRAVKKQDPASVEAYKRSLERVFAYSRDYQLKVPPGLNCDYAMLLLKEGDVVGARDYMLKEMELYPESGALIGHLIQRYELQP